MESINEVTVIIRSVGERTEQLCEKLILKQGIPHENLIIINEKPFSKAMRVGYQLGIDKSLPLTYIIDADVLLREDAIIDMIKAIEKMPKNTLGISGSLLDKLFGKKRTAGNHLFKTTYLDRMIAEIKPYDEESIRPESTIINKLKNKGLFFKKNTAFIGLHDFEQDFRDIARKSFTHSIKHAEYLSEFVSFWKSRRESDPDFEAALFGLSKGIIFHGCLKIDIKIFESMYDRVIKDFGEKSNEISAFDLQSNEDVLTKMEDPNNYFFPNKLLDERFEKIFRKKINEKNYVMLFKHIAGKFLLGLKP